MRPRKSRKGGEWGNLASMKSKRQMKDFLTRLGLTSFWTVRSCWNLHAVFSPKTAHVANFGHHNFFIFKAILLKLCADTEIMHIWILNYNQVCCTINRRNIFFWSVKYYNCFSNYFDSPVWQKYYSYTLYCSSRSRYTSFLFLKQRTGTREAFCENYLRQTNSNFLPAQNGNLLGWIFFATQ